MRILNFITVFVLLFIFGNHILVAQENIKKDKTFHDNRNELAGEEGSKKVELKSKTNKKSTQVQSNISDELEKKKKISITEARRQRDKRIQKIIEENNKGKTVSKEAPLKKNKKVKKAKSVSKM